MRLHDQGASIYISQRTGQLLLANVPVYGIFSYRFDKRTGYRQLRVDTGLLSLKNLMPPDGICMMILTMFDLYADASDLFVAGIAQMNHRMGIFSLHRYNPNLEFSSEFWHDVSITNFYSAEEQAKLVLQRSCRLLVHETMHLLGFNHCIYYSCCMNGSGHLKEDFNQPMFLCPVDLLKLKYLCGICLRCRYEHLQEFFKDHCMASEVTWIKEKLELLPCCNCAIVN